MVSYLKLAKLKWKRQQYKWMDDSTQDVTWWLEMVKIARKGFKVLSKGEGQAMAWRPKSLARVKKEVLAFSWGTNQVTRDWRLRLWEMERWMGYRNGDGQIVCGLVVWAGIAPKWSFAHKFLLGKPLYLPWRMQQCMHGAKRLGQCQQSG